MIVPYCDFSAVLARCLQLCQLVGGVRVEHVLQGEFLEELEFYLCFLWFACFQKVLPSSAIPKELLVRHVSEELSLVSCTVDAYRAFEVKNKSGCLVSEFSLLSTDECLGL